MGVLSGFGEAMRRLRERRGISSQLALAEAAGVSLGTVNKLETGKRLPDFQTTEALLDAMGFDLHDVARALDEVKGRAPQRTEAEADPRVVAAITNHWKHGDREWLLGYAAAVIDPEEPGSHERFAASVEVAASELGRFVLSQMAAPRPKSDDESSN